MKYYQNYSLKNHNSFRLESIAKEIWFPKSTKDLRNILVDLKDKQFFILSGGTNVLLKPVINRLICLTEMPTYITSLHTNKTSVSANYSTSVFVNIVLNGFEGLYGIPGKIGGAIVMNAGSGKYAISDHIVSVTTMDLEGHIYTYTKEDMKFERRSSILQGKKEIVLEAVFDTSIDTVDEVELEKAKQHRKTIPTSPSAGGCFKNWHSLKPYEKELIGLNVGDAVVSEKVNIIVNKGNATYDNIMDLIGVIQSQVEDILQLEIKIIG